MAAQVIPLARQLVDFEANVDAAIDDLHRILDENRERIRVMEPQRAIDGFAKYGDSAATMSPADRLRNILEELCDATFYRTQGDV